MTRFLRVALIIYFLSTSSRINCNDLYGRSNGWDVEQVAITTQDQFNQIFQRFLVKVENTWATLMPFIDQSQPQSQANYFQTNPDAAAPFNMSNSSLMSNPTNLAILTNPNSSPTDIANAESNATDLKSIMATLQLLYLNKTKYGNAENNLPTPMLNNSVDFNTVLTGQNYTNSFVRILTIYKLFLVKTASIPQAANYTAELKADINTCSNIINYMFNNYTQAQVADIDAKIAAQNAQANMQNTIASIKSFFAPILKIATPEQMLSLKATFTNVEADGSQSVRTGYLTINANGVLWCDSSARYNRASYFNVEVSPADGSINLKSPFFGNKYLTDVSKDSVSPAWTFDYKKRASNITAAAVSVDTSTAKTNSFVFKNTSPNTINPCFQLKSSSSGGFWVIESDWCIRSFKTTLESYAIGAELTIEAVTPFHLDLADALSLPSAKKQILAVKTIAMDPYKVKSEDDLRSLMLKLEDILKQAAMNADDWYDVYASVDDIILMLIYIRKSFVNSWLIPMAPETKTQLTRQLGDNAKNLTDADHLSKLKSAFLLKTYIYDKSVDFITKRFENLSYAKKVQDLMNRVTTLTADTIDKFMTDLELITVPKIANNISSTDLIVQAFPDDFKNINNVISNLKWTQAFLDKDNNASNKGNYTSRINNVSNALQTAIPVKTYLEYLDNFAKTNTSFSLEQKNFFKACLQRIVDSRTTSDKVTDTINTLITVLQRVINNQMKDMATELVAMLNALTGELASSTALTNYSTRIKDLKNLVEDSDFGANSVKIFMTNLQSLVDDRVDATKSDIQDLFNYLTTTSDSKILTNQILPFYDNGNTLKQIFDLAKQLQQPVDFAKRASNLRAFIQNNPPSKFIDAGGIFKTTIGVSIEKDFIIPLFDKLEMLIQSLGNATPVDKESVASLIDIVGKNQLKLSLDQQVSEANNMFAGKSIKEALQRAKNQISGQLTYDEMTYSAKVSALQTLLTNSDSTSFNPSDFCDKVSILSSNKIMLDTVSINNLITLLNESLWKAAFKGFKYNTKEYNTFVSEIISNLNTPANVNDVINILTTFAARNDNFSLEEQTSVINLINMLMGLQQSIDSSNSKTLSDLINKIKFNQISAEYRPQIDTVLNMIAQMANVSPQTISNKIKTISDDIKKLSTMNSIQASAAAAKIIQNDIPTLLNTYVIDATTDDLSKLSALFDLARWNSVISNSSMTYSIPSASITSKNIAYVVDNYFKPFLTKQYSFSEIFESIKAVNAGLASNLSNQAIFLARSKKLSALANQGSSAQLTEAISLLQTAKFNYMTQSAAELDTIIQQLTTALSTKVDATTISTSIPVFSTEWENFTSSLAKLTTATLPNLVTLFQKVLDIKPYTKQADLKNAINFMQSPSFQNNNVIQWQGGYAMFDGLIQKYSTPIEFNDEYKALKELIKRAAQVLDNSQGTVLSAYLEEVLKEKLGNLATSGNLVYTNKISFDDVTKSIQALKQSTLYANISVVDKFTSLDDLLSKIKAGMRNQENFNLTFSQRIEVIKTLSATLKTPDDALNYYEYLVSLVEKRVEGSTQDLSNLNANIKSTYYSTQFIDLLNQAKNITTAGDSINEITNKLASPIDNNEKMLWLIKILTGSSLAPHHPAIILNVLSTVIATIQNDSSGNSRINDLLTACDKAMYTLLKDRTDFAQLIQKLKIAFNQAGANQSDQGVIALQNLFANLTSSSSDIIKFISDATTLVNKKYNLQASDISQILDMLTGLQFKDGFISNKNIIFNSGVTIGQQVDSLINNLKQPDNFPDLLQNLMSFYKTYEALGFSPENKTIFMDKLNKVLALQDPKLVKFTDTDDDKIFVLINFLNKAAYNQLISEKNTLLPIIQNLINFRAKTQASMPPTFSSRVKSLPTLLSNLKNENDVTNLLNFCQALYTDRVQGTAETINYLKNWLASSTSPLTTNAIVYNSGKLDKFYQISVTLNDPVSLSEKFAELQRMIKEQSPFSSDDKLEFFTKLKELAAKIADFASNNFNKQDLSTLINFVKINNFISTDTFVDKSTGTSITKNYYVELDIIKANIDNFVSGTVTEKSFSQRLNDWKSSLNNVKDTTMARQFINAGQALASLRIDASKADIEAFINFITSDQVKANENLYSVFGNFNFVDQLKDAITEPVLYADRISKLTEFITKNKTFTPDQKNTFVGRIALLYDDRAKAKEEKINLEDLQTLLNLVIKNRFDANLDREAIGQINNFLQSLNPQIVLTSFGSDLQALLKTYFNDQPATTPNIQISIPTGKTITNFVDSVESLVQKKADSTPAELNDLITLLSQSSLINTRVLFTNTAQKTRLLQLIDTLKTPITFADLANNIISMINGTETFSDTEKIRFKNKLKKISDLRGDGYSTNYDMDNLTQWIGFCLNNQMKNDSDVAALYQIIKTKPKISDSSIPFKSFADALADKKAELESFSNAAQDSVKVNAWVQSLQALVNSKIDGMTFNTTTQSDDLSVITDFINYLDNTARYNTFIYNKPLEATINSYINSLKQTPSFTDLLNNLQNLANNNAYFSTGHKNIFVNQLDRMVSRKSEATAAQVEALTRTINFTAVNKFTTQAEGGLLLNYIDSFKNTTDYKDIASNLDNVETIINGITAANASTVTDVQKQTWINTLKPSAYKLVSLTSGSSGKLDKNIIDLATRIKDAGSSLRNRIFANNADFSSDINTTVIARMQSIIDRG